MLRDQERIDREDVMELVSSNESNNSGYGESGCSLDNVQWATRGIVSIASEEDARMALQKAEIDGRHFIYVLPPKDA